MVKRSQNNKLSMSTCGHMDPSLYCMRGWILNGHMELASTDIVLYDSFSHGSFHLFYFLIICHIFRIEFEISESGKYSTIVFSFTIDSTIALSKGIFAISGIFF